MRSLLCPQNMLPG